MHTELDERVALKFLLPEAAAQNPEAVGALPARGARRPPRSRASTSRACSTSGTLESGAPVHRDGVPRGQRPRGRARRATGACPSRRRSTTSSRRARPSPRRTRSASSTATSSRRTSSSRSRPDGAPVVKVLDFGISKASSRTSRRAEQGASRGRRDVIGSPIYMSPEQIKSARDVDARADIWSLGVILYELLTGTAPFDRPTVAETFGAILYEKPAPLAQAGARGAGRAGGRSSSGASRRTRAPASTNVAELAKALFPFAANATRASLERTSPRAAARRRRRSTSVPPPSLDGGPGGRDQPAVTMGDPQRSPRSRWGPSEGPARPAPVAVGASRGAVRLADAEPRGTRRARSRGSRRARARVRPCRRGRRRSIFAASAGCFWFRRTRPAPAAVVPVVAEAPVSPGHGPPPVVTATPSVVQAAVAPAPSATAVATVVPGPMPSAPVRGKLPSHKGKPGAPASTGAPTAAPAPPKPPEDDFNDRK